MRSAQSRLTRGVFIPYLIRNLIMAFGTALVTKRLATWRSETTCKPTDPCWAFCRQVKVQRLKLVHSAVPKKSDRTLRPRVITITRTTTRYAFHPTSCNTSPSNPALLVCLTFDFSSVKGAATYRRLNWMCVGDTNKRCTLHTTTA